MIKFRFINSLFLAMTISITSGAQNNIKPLTVGDSLPDFNISKTISPIQSGGRTSDYKDRLLIIDFWSTGCSACIKALPRMESLQKRFGDKIKILPLTYEKTEKIIPFWHNNKYTKSLSISSVVEDKMFHAYFPHYGVPHEVWVYKGKVIGITESEYVDVPNIQRVLDGEKVNWTIKYDFYKFDRSKSLFDLVDKTNFIEYSAIRSYLPGVNSMGFTGGHGIVRDTVNKMIRTYIINEPIYVSYLINLMNINGAKHLAKPTASLDSNQVIWEVTNPSRYMHSYKDIAYPHEWVIKNAICFESVQKDIGQNDIEIYNKVNQDLDRLLGLFVRWEKRNEKVWVLKKILPSKQFPTSGTSGIGLSISELSEMFNRLPDHVYVFDETNMVDSNYWMNKVNIDKNASLSSINKIINSYGFEMIEEKRDVDKLIFSEINYRLRKMEKTK